MNVITKEQILDMLKAFPGQDIWLWEDVGNKAVESGLFRALPDGSHAEIIMNDVVSLSKKFGAKEPSGLICPVFRKFFQWKEADPFWNAVIMREAMLTVYWKVEHGKPRLITEPWRMPLSLKRLPWAE